jgi:hypothetical protein
LDRLTVAVSAVVRSFSGSSVVAGQLSSNEGLHAVLVDWLWQQAALLELRLLPQPQRAALAALAVAAQAQQAAQRQRQLPLPQQLRLLAVALSPRSSDDKRCRWASCIAKLIARRRLQGSNAEVPPEMLAELNRIHAESPLRPSQEAQLWAVAGIRL